MLVVVVNPTFGTVALVNAVIVQGVFSAAQITLFATWPA
jgi:hypothetical protein